METAHKRKKMRSSTPRVRSGCQTCRKRHLKCDETKPSCLRCVQAGWTCDGYVKSNTDSKVPASKKSAAAAATTLPSAFAISTYEIPFKIPGSQRDRQSLHYFCVQGSHEIAGQFNTDFWTKDVLQQSHQEPVVRQALALLGSIHLEYTTTVTPGNGTVRDETLIQYGRALRALNRCLGKADLEATKTALTCAILFYCVEAALGNSEAAMCHLQGGLKLLSSYDHRPEPEKTEDFNALSRVYKVLDLQATFFDDQREPQLISTADLEQHSCATDITSAGGFLHLGEAHQTLVKLLNLLFRFLTTNMPYKSHARDSLPASVLMQKMCLTEEFKLWLDRFDHVRIRKEQGEGAVCGVQILLIHWQLSTMLLEADYPADPSVFAVTPNFRAREILSHANDMLRHTGKQGTSEGMGGNSRRNLSSEIGIVAPLFTLAMKCSDERVRRRATELLAESQRREGLYDAQKMVTIIQQFEEARQQKRLQFNQQGTEDPANSSLEKVFEVELNGASARNMDELASFFEPDRMNLS